MFIDDGEAGMWIEFENAEDNVYEEGDKLSIHLYGQKLSIDSYCNSIKLDELASSCVKTVLPGSELTPVVLESFADISNPIPRRKSPGIWEFLRFRCQEWRKRYWKNSGDNYKKTRKLHILQKR